jgi:hypothetical protein
LEGRTAWTGEPEFWVGQIKQMLMANIDAVYVHCINNFEPQRVNYFKACEMLRRQGWDVPKVAPFLDPFYLWRERPIDVNSRAGKDEFVRHYVRFYDQYFSQNSDSLAPTYLLHIDGKVALASWWPYSMLQNLGDLTRPDVERRLLAALGNRMPSLRNGIYMMSTALIDPDYSFSDERMIMFSGYCYALHSVHQGIDVWHVQAGYWDQNIRQPGYLLPRDGGKNYRRAWDIVAFNMPYVHRVYVESWNEYDEGSGIFAADPGLPNVNPNMHSNTDTFSDSDDPFEYINTTARGAARINGRPENDAVILAVDSPSSAAPGNVVPIAVVVRNEGNSRLTGREGYGLLIDRQRVVHVDDTTDEIPLYGGIFRGRPLTFKAELQIGNLKGKYTAEVSMAKDGVPFGEKVPVTLNIQ